MSSVSIGCDVSFLRVLFFQRMSVRAVGAVHTEREPHQVQRAQMMMMPCGLALCEVVCLVCLDTCFSHE